ncbi:SLAC1 anion channel family protein [Cupriavidus consociatus]|uniref:SLAC1 anion channel family protein n=1 Tax=Cupriavidus consociatus TaxID=2821357 RepID=UPI001AE44F89|nr:MULTISPECIES: SLAC1 anion channel family protein [unclassified Cupriavidus]MBP0622256.1 SLAC1 anion channel family protein [Cupriavidus sp. LEh25]MDK2658933.1 SLAC1 anion channel family protein [Cupriavidus sp. LEh21]
MTVAAHLAAALPAPRSSVKHLPVNLFAAVMGLSGLSLAWRGAVTPFGASPVIGDAVGVLAVLAFVALAAGYLAKWKRYPEAVRAEFSHPVAGNFFGTIAIAILLLSSVVGAHHAALGQAIWAVGTVLTVALTVVIAGRLLNSRTEPANVVPAWLIPGVATLDIAVAGGTMPMAWAHEVNLFAAAVGTVIALVFFTMIFSRLVHHDPLPAGMVPSLIILIAPFEVGFLAYVNVTGHVDLFAGMLFYFGLFLFVLLAWRVFRRPVQFAPSWWAISFPMAALSNAALKYADHVQAGVLHWLAGLILLVLTVAIAVLSARTLHSLFTRRLLAV